MSSLMLTFSEAAGELFNPHECVEMSLLSVVIFSVLIQK